jgi:hypothetical protein
MSQSSISKSPRRHRRTHDGTREASFEAKASEDYALGAAGVSLVMAGGAAATVPTTNLPSLQDASLPVITLDEEEIADVSLGTFYVFDKENEPRLGQGIRFAARGCGGCGRCGGCAAGRCGGCAGRCGCAGRGCAVRCGGCGCGGWWLGCAGCVSVGCGGGCWRWTSVRGWVWVCY